MSHPRSKRYKYTPREVPIEEYQNRINTLPLEHADAQTLLLAQANITGVEYTCEICGEVFFHESMNIPRAADGKIRCKIHKYVLDSTLAKQGRTEVFVHWLHEKECQCHFCVYKKIDIY